MESSNLELVKLNDASDGETVIFIGPASKVKELTKSISETVISYGFVPSNPDPRRFVDLSEQFKTLVQDKKLNRLTLVGVGWGGAIAIYYAANNIKSVRRVLFYDAISRPKQLPAEKALEWVERFLPLGLPFRPISKDFDPRPIIHRVRCPVLVVNQENSNIEELAPHTDFLMDRLPNAWHVTVKPEEFGKTFQGFIGVSTKQPQKASRGT